MIKVIIERLIAEGLEKPYEDIVSEILENITSAPGYISGESLRDLGKPNHHVIISSWRSVQAWENWAESEKRKLFMEQIAPLLAEQEKYTILESNR